MNDTQVERPFAVTRQVTGRLIAEFNAKGEIFIKGANGKILKRVILQRGQSISAVFALDSKWHCGAAVFQPAGWTAGCDGEMSLTLGNVDFPYLNDSGYVAKDQNERFTEIAVTFNYAEDGTGSIEGHVGLPDAGDYHGVKSLTPKNKDGKIGSHSVAFIAFGEYSAVAPENLNSPKLTRLASGGSVTFDLSGVGSHDVLSFGVH
jgi:hypothetical protein